jgi:SAM-dependent methyltransferase
VAAPFFISPGTKRAASRYPPMRMLTWPWQYFRSRHGDAATQRGHADETIGAILSALASIDRDDFHRRFPGSLRLKYLNFDRFVARDVAYCRLLGLDRMPPARILDIGCGTGLFLYAVKHFGHRGVGIDIEDEFYRRMAAKLGVDRRIEPVTPFVPLRVDGPFDLITAIATTFDRYYAAEDGMPHLRGLWGASEWAFFLKDLQRLLTPDGRVFLKLNKTGHEDRPNAALAPGVRGASGRALLYDRETLASAIEELAREAEIETEVARGQRRAE